MWISRLVPDAKLQHYSESLEANPNKTETELLPLDSLGPVRAAFETPGILSSIYCRPYTELQQPIPDNHIEVKVAAISLNWKDVGLSSRRFDANNLSSEYAGTVVRTGSGVTKLAVGDRVYGMGRGHFGNYTGVPASFAQRLRPSDDIVKMATMPLVYMTAVYAFEHVTRLQTGETVLIHSSSGGLGLAAIQVTRAKGAQVFVTAGTPAKMRFLAETMAIPNSNIFLSSDLQGMIKAVAMLPKEGFDVILSTANGDALYTTMKILAPLGRLIDVGRMDVQEAKTIGLELFQKSATFSSFDLTLVLDRDAQTGERLMRTVDEYYRSGQIVPISPCITGSINHLDQILLGFSRGIHIGKHVVTFLDPESLIKVKPQSSRVSFNPEAYYIVTGGLSGLGKSIIHWMSNRGAHNFIVFSRKNADSVDAQALIKAHAPRGIDVRVISCDVADRDQVQQAIQQVSHDRPIRGVVHAAVSYQDISFDKVTPKQWQDGLAAKVQGTVNLHEATSALPLDFFVMTTSVEPIFAPATQSAYTAANNFQDYFARFRHRCGLPASIVAFGLVTNVGHLSTNTVSADLFMRHQVLTLSEHQFLNQIEPAFLKALSAQQLSQSDDEFNSDPLSVANYITCMDPAEMVAQSQNRTAKNLTGSIQPRWHNDGRVALLMRAVDDARRHENDADLVPDAADQGRDSAVARLRREFEVLIKSGEEGRDQAFTLVLEGIVTAVAEMLFLDHTMINTSKPVADQGVDSLIAAELRNWFHVALGFKITTLDLLDARKTISVLAADIVDEALQASTE